MNFPKNYLNSVIFEFNRYKTLGDNTFAQLDDADIFWKNSDSDNSIALIVKHVVGNMLSRWTNFLTEDGEKPWRHRESEFENPYSSISEMVASWEKGWKCLFAALKTINEDNFDCKISVRNEENTIIEAVNRQLAHYANHVGQIVLLGKMIKGTNWNSLSIPKGKSDAYNKEKFNK